MAVENKATQPQNQKKGGKSQILIGKSSFMDKAASTLLLLLFLRRQRNQIQLIIQFPIFILPPFIRMGIFDQAINLSTFVIFGQIFGDGHAIFIGEEQSVAIFPLLHLVTSAHPAPFLRLFLFVGVEITGAQRPA